CLNSNCPQFRNPYRPEAAGRLALPKPACGLDVIAFVGTRRYAQHRSISDIHQALVDHGVAVAQCTVPNLLERSDALRSLNRQDTDRLRRLTQAQGRVIFALDSLQPARGHAVFWVIRACLSGDVLLAQRLLSASPTDLAALLHRVKQALRV